MKITPEQIARLIFLVSNLRSFEKEYTLDPTFENRSDMIKYQTLLDDFLIEHGMDKFIPEQELADMIVLTRNPHKQAV